MTIRLGLAGLGVHGSRYARHLLAGDVPGARLTTVSRSDEPAGREFAREHGLQFVGRPEDLATVAGVDAVVVVLPPDLHPAVAGACVREGRPVLVEKPVAANLDAARELSRLVERTGTPLMVAQTLRFDRVVRNLRRDADSLGPLCQVTINQRFEPSSRKWLDDPAAGGMFLNTAVHGFDLMRYLTGLEPGRIYAEARCGLTQRTEDQLVATVVLSPGGVLATLDNVRSTRSRSGRVEMVGEAGQLWGDHVHRTFERLHGTVRTDLGPVPVEPTLPAALRSFVDGLVAERAPEVGIEDGVAAVEMVVAAKRSADERRPVHVSELRAG